MFIALLNECEVQQHLSLACLPDLVLQMLQSEQPKGPCHAIDHDGERSGKDQISYMVGFQSVPRGFRSPGFKWETPEGASHQRGLEITDSRPNQPCPGIFIHGPLLLSVFRSSIS